MISTRSKFTKVVSVGIATAMFSMATPTIIWSDLAKVVKSAIPEAEESVATRKLTADELGSLRGRSVDAGTDANPYIAGQSKWGVNYRGVDLLTGNFSFTETDLSFEGGYGIPVAITRTYSANNPDEGPLGRGWTLSVDLRTTAGGLMKGGGSPSRSVPVQMVPKGLNDKVQPGYEPEPPTSPAQWLTEGMISEDASGLQTIIQRDVDGVLTPPAWDKNKVDTEYVDRIVDGKVIQFTDHITVTTPEGTVYYYDELGYVPHDTVQGAPGKSSVMKIVTVTDRHGNITTYTYDTGSYVQYDRSAGTTFEYRLDSIDMPGGRGFDFDWDGDRLDSITDGERTVEYDCSGGVGGQLKEVVKPGGFKTNYVYKDVPAQNNGDLLHEIKDHRGFVTKIFYDDDATYTPPMEGYGSEPFQGVVVKRILFPNGQRFIFRNTMGTGENLEEFDGYLPGYQPDDDVSNAVLFDANDNFLRSFIVGGSPYGPPDVYRVSMAVLLTLGKPPALDMENVYDLHTLDLLESISRTSRFYDSQGIDGHRRLDAAQFAPDSAAPILQNSTVVATTSYNYFGAPLQKVIQEDAHVTSPSGSTYPSSSKTIQYAYWGEDKYFQQKAVKDPEGRISFTDYFDSSESTGKGQVKSVYDAKHTTYSNSTGENWRTLVSVNQGTPAATFTYDEEGRPLTVVKQGPTGNVTTKTEYSGAQGTYGNATKVIEDFGGINRTTETLTFDEIGRAVVVKDAMNRVIETVYDPAGNVTEVKRTSGTPKTFASYSYNYATQQTANYGTLTEAIDHVGGVRQELFYHGAAQGGATGQVSKTEEWSYPASGLEPLYKVEYDYNDAGDRAYTKYTTPNGVREYEYTDYISVGSTDDKRVFRTMTALLNQNPEPEQFHYSYDSAGRLVHAAFMQVPKDAQTSYLTDQARTRAHAYYLYDEGGRIKELHTLFGNYTYNENPQLEYYTYTKVLKQAYVYDQETSLRSDAYFYQKAAASNNWSQVRHETYGYDELGQLTSANYGGGATNWTYDPAGNRSGTGYAYDKLNRMTASPGSNYYQHDILGNRTWKNYQQSSVQRYVWDEMGRLSSLCGLTQGAKYHYRVDGLRVKKVEGLTIAWIDDDNDEESKEEASGHYDEYWATNKPTTRYYYDGQMGFEDDYTTNPGGGPQVTVTRYALGARGIDGIETTTAQGSTAVYPVYDGHGNMIATLARATNDSFTRQHNRVYDAWGNVTSGSGGDQGYVANLGHRKDAESGLTYMRARYYEPGTGRFISQDPSKDGQNWYVYAANNPVNNVDPTGRFIVLALINALIGGILGAINGHYTPGSNALRGFLAGAGAGFAGGLTGNPVVAGFINGLLNSVFSDIAAGQMPNWRKAFATAAGGAAIGGVAGYAFKTIGRAVAGRGILAEGLIDNVDEWADLSVTTAGTTVFSGICNFIFD